MLPTPKINLLNKKMKTQDINKFLKFFVNFDWYRFGEMTSAIADGDTYLAEDLLHQFEANVAEGGRVQAGINLWFGIDAHCQERLVEFIDRNYSL